VVILAQRVPNSGRSNREYDAGPVAGADPARINFAGTDPARINVAVTDPARINFAGADHVSGFGTRVTEVVEFSRAAEVDPRGLRRTRPLAARQTLSR